MNHGFFSVDLHPVTACPLYRRPLCLIAGNGQLCIGQEICNGDAVDIQDHIVEESCFSVETKLNLAGRIAALIHIVRHTKLRIGINADFFHSICGNVEGHPLAGFQACHTGGQRLIGAVILPESQVITAKEECVFDMLAFHIDADGQIFAFHILFGEGFRQTEANGVIAPACRIIEAQFYLQNTLCALEFCQPIIGIVIADLVPLAHITAVDEVAIAFHGEIRKDSFPGKLGGHPIPVFYLPGAGNGCGIAVNIGSCQFVEKCTKPLSFIGVVHIPVGILCKISISLTPEFQNTLQIDAIVGGSVLHRVQRQLGNGIFRDILQEEAVGNLQKFHNRSCCILHGKSNFLAYPLILRVGINDLIIAGFQRKCAVFIGPFAIIFQVNHFILHIVGYNAAIFIGNMGNRKLNLLAGVLDHCIFCKVLFDDDFQRAFAARVQRQRHHQKKEQCQ